MCGSLLNPPKGSNPDTEMLKEAIYIYTVYREVRSDFYIQLNTRCILKLFFSLFLFHLFPASHSYTHFIIW